MMQLVFIIFTLLSAYSALYDQGSSVIELSDESFDEAVLHSDEIWLIQFFASWCSHCKDFVVEFEKTANILKGIAKVGAVDGHTNKALLQRYNIKNYPTIKIFGVNKQEPTDYADDRECKSLVEATLQVIHQQIDFKTNNETPEKTKMGHVTELTNKNFDHLVLKSVDMWLIQFYSPKCQKCKEFRPHWRTVTNELMGKVQCGALDVVANEEIGISYNITKHPTLVFFTPEIVDQKKSVVEYKGELSSEDVSKWAFRKYVKNLPDPDIVQIIDSESFEETCANKSLCIVSVFPEYSLCHAGCRYEYLGILSDLGRKYKRMIWGWTWTEAAAQPDLETSLGVGGSEHPALAVVDFDKMKFFRFNDTFTLKGIDKFLKNISLDQETNISPLSGGKPKIVTTTPWNGYDSEGTNEEKDYEFIDFNERDEL